jgi:hypothetical protein
MQISLPRQIASFVGAVLILISYGGAQFGWISPRSLGTTFSTLSVQLFWPTSPFYSFQLGFVLLEVAWTVISLYALVRARAGE